MQEDKLRDFLKFFRFNLPWFVVLAGFFAVIVFAGLFISSKINLGNENIEKKATEKLELAVTGEMDTQPESPAVASTSSAIAIMPTPSNIMTPLPIPSISPVPQPPQKPIAPKPSLVPAPTPTAVPTPAPTPKTEESNVSAESTYVVVAGDSLWSIAERVYGTGFEYKKIMKANNIDNQFELSTGQTLVIPAIQKKGQIASGVSIDHGDVAGSPDQSVANLNNSSDYIVVKGDSLWKIAEEQLNDPYRWTEIYELNKNEIGLNPNFIYPDTILKLPEKLAVKIDDEDSSSSTSTNTSSNWTSSLIQ